MVDTKRLLRVFLCHDSADKTVVLSLYKRLVKDGFDAWIDSEKLLPGQNWQMEIPKVVKDSDIVIVCLSKNSVNKEGYVQKEIKHILDMADEKPAGTIYVIPARIEDCNVPNRLGIYQRVDLFTYGSYGKLREALHVRSQGVGAVLSRKKTIRNKSKLNTKKDSKTTKNKQFAKSRRYTTGSSFDSKLVGREFGKYRAERLISKHETRQTITLLAVDKETSQQVVLKAFGSFSEKSRREFEKEVSAFRKLKSKHGVLLPLETFEYEGDYYIVTEYKNGGDLRGWLKAKPKMAETLDIFVRIAESIDYVHENKIIHRDIKPENIVYDVLDGRITPYLMDFGISVTLSSTTSSFKTDHAFGTMEYMAPEFFSNVDDKKTKAVDIYAFGLMLYEALEGCHPFLGNSPQETIAQIISGAVPVPENTVKKLGESAGFMLTKALSKNPEDRPKTATEIIAQIGSQYIKYIGKAYGKYVIEEYLGRGPYGATYKACELNNRKKKVALKLLAVSQTKKPEIGGLKELERSKGVLPIIDAGNENGAQYLVSEYLDGDNLRYILPPTGMALQDLLAILKPLSKTLDYLHGKGIPHRNLKPENILLHKNRNNGRFQPFVSDCGISKIAEAAYVVNANGNVVVANINYLAPEILEGKELSAASDVYSLGVIIYEAVEGKTPFDAKSLPALMEQKLNAHVPEPENLIKNGGMRAARVLWKALSVKPEKRQQSASDLVFQFEYAIMNRSFRDTGIFNETWVKARKLISDFLDFFK